MTTASDSAAPSPAVHTQWEEIAHIIWIISQGTWAGRWLVDSEHRVYDWTQNPDAAPDHARHYLTDLARLARDGGQWVRWDDDEARVVPMPMDEFLTWHEEWTRVSAGPSFPQPSPPAS